MQDLMSRVNDLKKANRHKIDPKHKPNDYDFTRDITENSVTKSNALSRGFYKFNLIEKRIMEALISQLNPLSYNESQVQLLEINAVDYAKTFNVSVKMAYEDIRDAVDGLLSKVFKIKPKDKIIKFNLMSHAEYIEKKGKIICSFSNFVTPELVGLRKKFTKYPLKIASNFKSVYTWRIYELLVSWSKSPIENKDLISGWFCIEMDEIRGILGVPESYTWSHFNLQVLDVVKKELAKTLKIYIKIDIKKIGKKIAALKITFNQEI